MDCAVACVEAAEGIQRPQQPIDIEMLLQWVIARTGRLPWRRDHESELSMNRGLTARPKRRDKIGWATAGIMVVTVSGYRQGAVVMRRPGPDAEIILAAIQCLDPATAAAVIACARSKICPDWMEGVVPRRVMKPVYGYKRNRRRRGRSIMAPAWEPCSPAAVHAARAAYARWHSALAVLAEALDGQLEGWRITGCAVPATPWISAPGKIA